MTHPTNSQPVDTGSHGNCLDPSHITNCTFDCPDPADKQDDMGCVDCGREAVVVLKAPLPSNYPRWFCEEHAQIELGRDSRTIALQPPHPNQSSEDKIEVIVLKVRDWGRALAKQEFDDDPLPGLSPKEATQQLNLLLQEAFLEGQKTGKNNYHLGYLSKDDRYAIEREITAARVDELKKAAPHFTDKPTNFVYYNDRLKALKEKP